MNQIRTDKDAREKLISGVDLVTDRVKVTLGPSGKNVIIRTLGTTEPFTTKDGATIARQIYSEDPFEQLAIECMQAVSTQSEQQAGDGTTGASVLAQAMKNHWVNTLKKNNNDYNPIEFKRGMTAAARRIEEFILKNAIPIDLEKNEGIDKIADIAMVSTNHDLELSKVIVDAFKNSSDNGIVNVSRSKTGDTYLKIIDGMVLPMSFTHLGFINNKQSSICELENPFVLMTNIKANSMTDNFVKILEVCAQNDKPILIICDEIHDDIKELILSNVIHKQLRACICRAPEFGNNQRDMLDDLGIVLGGVPFLEDNGHHWNDYDLEPTEKETKEILETLMIDGNYMSKEDEDAYNQKALEYALKKVEKFLPSIKSVIVNKKSTSIKMDEPDANHKAKIQERIKFLELEIEGKPEQQEYDINLLKARKARLTAGICYIYIHANSEMEYIEKQHRVEDALHSVKWAAKKGIVPGGGSYLYTCQNVLKIDPTKKFKGSYRDGINCVINSLDAVFNQILENAGVKNLTSNEQAKLKDPKLGYNVRKNEISDMIKDGVIDSAHVVARGVVNAATIIGDIITTEVAIVDPRVYEDNRRAL